MTSPGEQRLSVLLERLVREKSLPATDFDPLPFEPEEIGLAVGNGRVLLPPGTTTLDRGRIRAALPAAAAAWLRELRVYWAIDSTNSRMVAAAQADSVDGLCWFAELQTAGRGRRGRSWVSSFARNLTLSLGFALGGAPRDAGALSLVIGLAVADLVERLGVAEVSLKWPNDVLAGGAKLCGILIELVAHRRPLECVVGIGLNLDLPADIRAVIGQQVTDLGQQGVRAGRDAVAAGLISTVVRYVEEFRRFGFRGMRSAYDRVHICHGSPCRILQGNMEYGGTVLGVTGEGELRLQGPDGERRFNGGEVSLLRGASTPSRRKLVKDAG